MIKLSPKTILKLCDLINEVTTYRSGPMLVDLFNSVGFRDVYGQGFPSRRNFTKDHLERINGRTELESIIRKVFNPREFSESPENFASCVEALNSELQFDGWNIYWDDSLADISFKRVKPTAFFQSVVNARPRRELTKEEFLNKEFADINFDGLISVPGVLKIVEDRLGELKNCLRSNSPLSAIFLTGSILEAILLAVATGQPSLFCAAKAAPKDSKGATLPITKWYLDALINVAKELGFLKEDVHKFCHVVRDFRNYIHPFEQNARGFTPDIETAKICFQVLKGAVVQIRERSNQVS